MAPINLRIKSKSLVGIAGPSMPMQPHLIPSSVVMLGYSQFSDLHLHSRHLDLISHPSPHSSVLNSPFSFSSSAGRSSLFTSACLPHPVCLCMTQFVTACLPMVHKDRLWHAASTLPNTDLTLKYKYAISEIPQFCVRLPQCLKGD